MGKSKRKEGLSINTVEPLPLDFSVTSKYHLVKNFFHKTYESSSQSLINKQYGKWNAIFATHNTSHYVFYQSQSKLFPESLDEWVSSIKKSIFQQTFSPARLDIDITNQCSHNCVMCFARELRTNQTMIPFSRLICLFNDFKNRGGKSVRLTGGGDPLNHPGIINIIKYLASLDLKITIETNGDLISPFVAKTIAKYVQHCRISVDAFDNTSRKKVHRPNNKEFTYHSLKEKIRWLRKYSEEYGRHEELFLGATFILLPENYLGVRHFINDMYDLGVNWVAIRKNIYREIYQQYPEILPFAEQEIQRGQELLNSENANFTIEQQYGVSFHPAQDFNTCWVSRARSIILADQSLQMCCLTRNGLVPESNLGFLPKTDEPFSELINTTKSQQEHFYQSVPQHCSFCIDKDNNTSFDNLAMLLKINNYYTFSKAHVYLAKTTAYFPGDYQIMQIALAEADFNRFQAGSRVQIIC